MVVLGAFGGRLDHEFSHYHVLFKFSRLRLLLLAPGRAAFVLSPGRHVINTAALGRSCGLIPLAGPADRSVQLRSNEPSTRCFKASV